VITDNRVEVFDYFRPNETRGIPQSRRAWKWWEWSPDEPAGVSGFRGDVFSGNGQRRAAAFRRAQRACDPAELQF